MVLSILAFIQETAAKAHETQAAAQDHTLTIIGPLINVGAVGVCLIVLGLYYRVKDNRYEQRIDERIKRESEFLEKYAAVVEKQHALTEKVVTSLEILTSMLKSGGK